jgi:TonB dependent receptor/TonB-dependent Receptor Plug Domain
MRSPPQRVLSAIALAVALAFAEYAHAGGAQEPEDPQTLAPVLVTASAATGISATEGRVTREQIELRPLSRPGEVLETVPGLIVTQHSGEGKANQFFLRGFNLDHGTDLRTTVGGIPVNLPTHAHGHGYTDVNFLIPELVERVRYKKGPYYAEEGDFSAAGAVHVDYVSRLDAPLVKLELGQRGYRQLLAAGSAPVGGGDLLFAAQRSSNDGPWVVPETLRKNDALIRFTRSGETVNLDIAAQLYEARWNATDQLAKRAVDAGLISRFGTLDASNGGKTHRHALSVELAGAGDTADWRVKAYAIRYGLNLFSNFTYFAADPIDGDQFEQADRRNVFGLEARAARQLTLGGMPAELSSGLQLRQDRIKPVGLYLTANRSRLSTVRQDDVKQTQTGLWGELALQPTAQLRAVFGLRADDQSVDVASDLVANSGKANDSLVSPKFSLIHTLPLSNGGKSGGKVQTFFNAGRGFHSNDARGAVTRVDPASGDAVEPVTLLVPARGLDLGARYVNASGSVQTALSLWRLDIDSELLFIGDAGTTEATRPSRRAGIEWSTYFKFAPGWVADFDVALSRARFRDSDPAGNRIPGAIERTASFGVGFKEGRWDAGVRGRYFGPRPLIEDNSVRSGSSTLINLQAGYRPTQNMRLSVEIINVLDRAVSDIEYFYESQLAGEPAPVADIHTHPALPRTVRAAVTVSF